MFVAAVAFGGGGGCSSSDASLGSPSGAATDGAADSAAATRDGDGPQESPLDGVVDVATGNDADLISDGPASPPDATQDTAATPATDGPTFTGWHSLTPSPLPAAWPKPRSNPGIAFDELRGKLVLFGGHRPGFGSYDYETWELDVASGSWTNRTVLPRPSSWPTGRDFAGMAYDSSVGRVVLFGGNSDSGPTQDLWEWDGATGTWIDRTAPPSASWPSRRGYHAVAYDTKRARLVLFGGSASGEDLQDLWEWDGKTGAWSNRTPSPLPTSWPARRYVHQLAYDPTRGVVTLFGGLVDLKTTNDTWEWNGSSGLWTERTPPSGAPNPVPREDHAMGFDATRGRIVMFGGRSFPLVVFHDTWEWNGTEGRWTDLTPAPLPASWPSGRMFLSGGMCFASALGRVVFFGGMDADSVVKNDLWEWWGP